MFTATDIDREPRSCTAWWPSRVSSQSSGRRSLAVSLTAQALYAEEHDDAGVLAAHLVLLLDESSVPSCPFGKTNPNLVFSKYYPGGVIPVGSSDKIGWAEEAIGLKCFDFATMIANDATRDGNVLLKADAFEVMARVNDAKGDYRAALTNLRMAELIYAQSGNIRKLKAIELKFSETAEKTMDPQKEQ